MRDLYSHSGNYLRVCRINQKLTQRELAHRLGVHVQFVSNWERGKCMPPKHTFSKLSKVLNFTSLDRETMFNAIRIDHDLSIKLHYKGLV